MNDVVSNMFWNLISEKMEKGEALNANFILWNYISRAGTRKREDWLGNSSKWEKRLSELQKNSELNEEDLERLYKQEHMKAEDILKKEIQQRDKFKTEAKIVLKQIRDSKISPVLKKGIGELLNNYLEMLDSEVRQSRKEIVDFDTWKKDFVSITSSIPYVKKQLKEAKDDEKTCIKILDGVTSCFPMPEGFKW